MTTACLDTNVWSKLIIANDPDEGDVVSAQYLMDQLERSKVEIVVPTIVLGELLLGVKLNDGDSQGVFEVFQGQYRIIPYDAESALLYAEIRLKNEPVFQDRTKPQRRKLSEDVKIVATCKKHSIDTLYTFNYDDFNSFSRDYIQLFNVRDITQ